MEKQGSPSERPVDILVICPDLHLYHCDVMVAMRDLKSLAFKRMGSSPISGTNSLTIIYLLCSLQKFFIGLFGL